MFKKLIFLFLLFNSHIALAEDITSKQQLEAFLSQTHTMSARFQQKLVDQYGFLLQQSAGSLSMQRPGKFRWDYILPYPQNIISNGKKIWMYDSELEQVNVRPYDQIQASSPVNLLDKNHRLDIEFEIYSVKNKDSLDWVKLIPKSTDSDFKEMMVGLLDGNIKIMRFVDNFNQQTEIEFEQLIINPEFKAELFEFVPPKGIETLGDF